MCYTVILKTDKRKCYRVLNGILKCSFSPLVFFYFILFFCQADVTSGKINKNKRNWIRTANYVQMFTCTQHNTSPGQQELMGGFLCPSWGSRYTNMYLSTRYTYIFKVALLSNAPIYWLLRYFEFLCLFHSFSSNICVRRSAWWWGSVLNTARWREGTWERERGLHFYHD